MVPSSLKRCLCFPVYYGLRRPPINSSPLWFDGNKERNVYFPQLQQRNSCHSTSDFPTRSLAQMAFAVKQIALQTPMYFEAGRSTRLFDNRRICVLETSFRTSMSLLFAEMLMPVSISVGFFISLRDRNTTPHPWLSWRLWSERSWEFAVTWILGVPQEHMWSELAPQGAATGEWWQ